jgi:formylglycine-generating enzyme required for sulfatase activity
LTQFADGRGDRYDQGLRELLTSLGLAEDTTPGAPTPSAPRLETRTDRVRALMADAQAALAAGRWSDALLKAELALQLPESAQDAELPMLAAQAAAGAGQWERAREATQQAIDQDNLQPERYVLLAQAERELGHPDQALAALDRAQALTPFGDADRQSSLRIERLRALAVRREQQVSAQQWERAMTTVEAELALAPDDPERLTAHLEILEALGRAPEALALARQLTAQPMATAALWLARARLAKPVSYDDGEVRSAVDTAERLAPADPSQTVVRRMLRAMIPPEHFPARLAELGFEARKLAGVEMIVPPLCTVPAGEFLMGSDPKRDRDAGNGEKPQHPVMLDAFQIGRYPVTVAEYACAVRAKAISKPWGNQRSEMDWQAQLDGLDHPVVYVSWPDAVAYARWLAQMTGQPWRLPSEAEWEKAARGTDGRIYPWGDAFDETRLDDIGIVVRPTIPVGSYPTGASPYGAHDMVGTVEEWTSSLYKRYPYRAGDGRERADSNEGRVLRLGSRAATRNYLYPNQGSSQLGFRLACAVNGS